MKTIDLETVSTTDKNEFLKKEFPWFHWKSFKTFKKEMEDGAACCSFCGVWYWEGCDKRCDHE